MKQVLLKTFRTLVSALPTATNVRFMKQLLRALPEQAADQISLACDLQLGIGTGSAPEQSGEHVVVELLSKAAEKEPVVFDIGANKGQYSSALIDAWPLQTSLNLHCFEPSASTFRQLTETLSGYDRIQLNNFGIGKTNEELTLFSDSEGSGMASLTPRRLDHFGIAHDRLKESVRIRTLEEYCQTHEIDQIDLLKIDVEGHELDVLNGGKKLFSNRQVRMVQFEFGGCNIDTRTFVQDFYYFFKAFDLDLYRILPSGNLFPLLEYRESDERFQCTNFLAVNSDIEVVDVLA